MKRILSLLVAMIMALSCVGITAMAEDAAVTTISTVADLEAFRNSVNEGNTYEGKEIELAADINLTSVDNWTPIGNGSRSSKSYTGKAFKGTFDGAGKTISGLSISSTTGDDAAIGLFGVIDGGTVKNLNLTNVNINVSNSDLVGGAIGMMLNNAIADNITVSGSVTGHDGVGGVVGRMIISGTISNCTNNASVTSSYGGIGGVVGKAYYEDSDNTSVFGTISGCTNNGTITAPMYIGGIVGLARCNVTGCTNNGAVVGGTQTGGIIGQLIAAGTVSDNVNNAKISGKNHMGGIIGDYTQSSAYTHNNVSITNNINRGELAATQQCAAIMGCNNIDGFTAMTASGNVSYYNADGLELFGNPEDMVIDATNKFDVELTPVAQIGDIEYATLAEAVANVKENETITILAGTISEGTIKLPATLKNVTFKGEEGAILEDMTIMASDGNSFSYIGLTFDGITFDNSRLIFTGWRNGEEVIENLTITNCVFQNLIDDTNVACVHINKAASEPVNGFIFINNVIDGATGGSKSGIYTVNTGKVIITGNTFNNIVFRPALVQLADCDGTVDNVVVSNNVISNTTRLQIYGSEVENEDGTYTPVGTDTLAIAINDNIFQNITGYYICTWGINGKSDIAENYYDGDISGKIYWNNEKPADEASLAEIGVYPYYTELNTDGTINTESLVEAPTNKVAKIGDNTYETLEAAFKAATDGCTIEILADVTIDYKWDCRDYATNGSHSQFKESVTINGNNKKIKFTGEVNDGNWNTIFRFEENATVKNLTVDISEATSAQRVITAKKSLDVDNLTIVGSAKYGIIFGEGATAADLADAEISIANSNLGGTRRAISDNEGGKDVKSVTVTGNTLNANIYLSASESITFNNNKATGEVDLRAYTAGNTLNVTATGNTLNTEKKNYIEAGGTINAQEEFVVPPTGSNSLAYTKEVDGFVRIWGEGGGNAKESFVLKLYSEDTLMATTMLNNIGGIIDGNVYVTWNFFYPESNDEYWTTTWEAGHPNKLAKPTKVELYIDGTLVSTTAAQMNGADGVNPVVWEELGGVKYVVTGLSGSGTEEDPYLINNLDDLKWFRDNVNTYTSDRSNQYVGKYVKLTSDIDLDEDGDGLGELWTPIGQNSQNDHVAFLGIFDGDGHTISNLYVDSTQKNAGFFASTGSYIETEKAIVKNITFKNVYVHSTSSHVGGVIGNSGGNTSIENLHVTGTIDIKANGGYVGGIVGHGYPVINNSSVVAEGVIDTAFWCAGGMVGYAGEGSTNVKNSKVEGTGETGIVIRSAAGAIGAIVGMASDNEETQPISGSNLLARNISLQTYIGAYGDSYSDYAVGYLYGGSEITKFTGTNIIENVTFLTSKGETNPPVVDAVAKVGNNIYLSLEDAFAAANTGDTVTLLSDVEMTDSVVISSKALTLDLGEYTIYDKNTTVLTSKDNIWGLIALKNSAKLTVCGNGKIECNYAVTTDGWTGMVYAFDVDATSELTVNSGYFTNGNGVIQTLGTVTVNNGTFVSHNGGTCIMAVNSTANVTVNDGVFKDSVGDNDVNTGSGAVWAGFGATVNINGGTYDFAPDPSNENVVWTLFPAQNAIAGHGENAKMIVRGGTFVNFNPSTDVIVGYSQSEGFTFGSVVAEGYAALADLKGNYVVGETPTATVKNLGAMTISAGDYISYPSGDTSADMPLNFVMQFVADQDADDMATSPFADWYADFVITFEGIKNDSFDPTGCYLAGYYGSTDRWDGMWVKIPVDGLLDSIDEDTRYPVMMGVEMPQSYEYICSGVQAFSCAMFIPEEILAENPDLKVNLELNVVDSSNDALALEALQTGKNIYKASETAYTAEDFKSYVAQIGEVKYTTLAQALDAAKAGDTVTIFAGDYTGGLSVEKEITVVGETDAEGNNLVNISGKLSITADGATVKNININNGNSTAGYISAKDVTVEGCSVVGGNGFRYCYTSGTVTFKDSVITGSTYGIHFDGNDGGNIVIDNCTITGWTSFAGTIEKVTISRTEFAEGNYNQLRFYQDAEITDSEFNPDMTVDFGKNNVELKITDCTVTDNSPITDIIYLGDIATMGIDVTINGESVVVEASVLDDGETKVKYYLTLEEAIAAAKSATVTLLSNVELTNTIAVSADKTITLDLAGNTITYNSTVQGEAMITNKGTLTINDSSESDTGVINYNYNGAADSSYGKGNYTISNAGTLTVNGGKIAIANLRGHAKYPIDNNSTTGDAILVINGGHLYNYNTSAIRQFCNSTTYKNSVTITGGKVEGYCAIWVQNPGSKTVNGSLSITGGEIKSTAAAYVNGSSALKDVPSHIYCTIDGEGGAWDNTSAIRITGGTINENIDLATKAPEALTVNQTTATCNGRVELPEIPVELFDFYGSNAVLGNSLSMDFYVADANLDGTNYYAEIKHYAEDKVVTTQIPYSDWAVASTGYHKFSYSNLAAKQIADKLEVAIFATDGTQASVTREDGLRAYAFRAYDAYAGKDDISDSNLRLLTAVTDMLNYGAAAQVEFNYNTNNLANAGTEVYQQYATQTTPELEDIRVKDDKVYGTNVTLKDNIILSGYFADVTSDMYAKITFNDHYGNPYDIRVEYSEFKPNGSYYQIDVDELAIADAAVPVTITVYNANDTKHSEVVESVNSYLCRAMKAYPDKTIFAEIAEFAASALAALNNK